MVIVDGTDIQIKNLGHLLTLIGQKKQKVSITWLEKEKAKRTEIVYNRIDLTYNEPYNLLCSLDQ